ncbi:hypothetical protein M9458_002409, partial [Cirrhinus mrigala]
MAQAKNDMSINMEISNGAVIHSPVGSCMEMEDRRTGAEEEEEDEVELAEEVDEDVNIGDDDCGESNAMSSTNIIIHKTEEEDIMEDMEEQVDQETVLQNKSTKEVNAGEMEEEEVEVTTPELQVMVELPTIMQTQVPELQNVAEELAGALKELDKNRADHKLETLYEDEKESDEMQTLIERQTETQEYQELLLSEVREFTCDLLEKIKNKSIEDQIQQVKSDTSLQEEEHEDVKLESWDDEGVKNNVDEEPQTVSSEGESVEDFQSLEEEVEPATFDNVGEEQSTTDVPLLEDCTEVGEPMHNDALKTNSDEETCITYNAPEERAIDCIATKQPSTDMIGGTIEEMVQNSNQLVESIVQEHEELERLQQVVGDTNLENYERMVAYTQSAIANGSEETRGADKEVEGIKKIQDESQRVVEFTEEPKQVEKEELPVEEESCKEVEQPLDDPKVTEEGACKKQEQLCNDKREVAEGGDTAKEHPRQVNQEVPAPREEGAGNWLEELKAVIEDEPRRKAQGGRKVNIPAWLKASESSDAHFQEPPKPLGSRIRSVSGGSEGEVNIKAKVQEVTMANGYSGIPAAVVQHEEEKTLVNTTKMATPAQQEGGPQDQQISLYVK